MSNGAQNLNLKNMSIEKMYYRGLPGAYAAREASLSQGTEHEKKSFLSGFLQGVQYAHPDPNVQKCPCCGSLFVHMSKHEPLMLNQQLLNDGKQYQDILICEFTCRTCDESYTGHLKISGL
jgi:hypothetical protein